MNYFTEVEGIHKTLAIKSAWDDSFLDILKAEEADVLRLSFSNGWNDDDLSFVEKLENIYGIEVYSWKITNLKSLHSIADIGYLAFEIDLKRVFDLSLFGKLESLKCTYSTKLRGLDALESLKHLNLSNYPYETLRELQHMTSLEELLVTSRKLKGSNCAFFPLLRKIDLATCGELESIARLENCTHLEELEIADCPKISKLPKLPCNLKSLVIEDCGGIDSLDFIESHPSLQRVLIIGSTFVRSGDLSPLKTLKGLKDVRVAEGSYNMCNEQIRGLVC